MVYTRIDSGCFGYSDIFKIVEIKILFDKIVFQVGWCKIGMSFVVQQKSKADSSVDM